MKHTTLTIAGCLAFIAIGASFNIEGPWITAVHWLLAGLGLLCIFGMLIAWGCERWEDVSNALDYRTANGFGIESQTRRLRANATRDLPRHQQPPFKGPAPRAPATVTSLDKAYQATIQQAMASGQAAGILRAQGGPVGVNPHKPLSRAHIAWLTSYEAEIEHKAAADAHARHGTRTAA